MTAIDPNSLQVSGGAGSSQAAYADLSAEAATLAETGGHLTGIAVGMQKDLLDPDLALSAVLDPGGAAKFEGELAGALDGPSGLLATAGLSTVRADAVRASVWLYQETDEAGRRLLDAAYWSAGYVAGVTAPAWAPTAVLAYLGAKELGMAPSGADLQDFLVHHPGLVGATVDAAPGLIDGLLTDVPVLGALFPGLAPTGPAQGAALLGLLYPDGHAVTTATGDPTDTTPPASVEDLLQNLEASNEIAGKQHGSIDVTKVTSVGPDGQPQTRWIVNLPGTSAWPGPGRSDNATDDGTDLHSLANQRTTYEDGVEQALRQAGVQPGQPIMLVGHSQGGMVATQTAADLADNSNLDVTDVVTAGSPIARMDVPSSVNVLSLENKNDIVPQLDGAPNDAAPNHTTVTFDQQNGSITGNHSIKDAYIPGAAAVDRSTDPSVLAWRQQANGFFTGTSAQTQSYRITRAY